MLNKERSVGIGYRSFFFATVFVVAMVLFAIPFYGSLIVNASSDFHVHLQYAKNIHKFSDIVSPHFGFQLGLLALSSLTLPLDAVGILLVSASYGAMAVMITAEMQRRAQKSDWRAASWVAIAVLVACQINLLTAWKPNLYYGYFNAISYHNPSQQLMKGAALAAWFLYVRDFVQDRRHVAFYRDASIAALCIISAVCKPSFLIAFLPCAGLRSLVDMFHRRWIQVLRYALVVAAPSILILLWQVWFAYVDSTNAGIAVRPFAIFPFSMELLIKGILSLAFPIFVGVTFRKELNLSSPLIWAYIFLTITLAYTLLLVETGPRSGDGNFAWSLQFGVFLVYVESAILFFSSKSLRTARGLGGLVIFGLHVACGLIMYAAATFFAENLWR
ncbi:hypothetical protein V1286_001558 [Bradyrhizobium algeriense]|uniref:Beta-carotene 15,15'-monooxygenase n=1 Tax=Bradyrhizobium algeriense TaxID=634784 RepID=A0ABU8B677_9BRAD